MDRLGEHLRAGRLDLDEFQDRTERALGARIRRDLDGLVTDLPPTGQTQPQSRVRGSALLLVGLALVAILAAISVAVMTRHGFWFPLWLIPIAFFTTRRSRRRTWTARSDRAWSR